MWIKQYKSVTGNSVLVTLGDPFFLILHLTALFSILLLGVLPGFTYGEHMRLLRDQCQALFLIIGCLAIAFGFIRVITDDIRRGAGAILMSRPISPFCLLFGKWSGVTLSMLLLHFTALAGYLWISETAFDAEYLNTGSLVLYLALIVFSLIAGALRHYLLGGSYVLYTNFILAFLLATGLVLRVCSRGMAYFDWPGLQSGLILIFAIISFSAFLLPIAVIADAAIVLVVGIITFFFGLFSDYLVNLMLQPGPFNGIMRSLLPNWQKFWIADRLGEGHGVPLGYFVAASGNAIVFLIICLLLATMIYERMEERGNQ